MISVVCIFLVFLGSVAAADVDNDNSKVSSNSISETNLVNCSNDNIIVENHDSIDGNNQNNVNNGRVYAQSPSSSGDYKLNAEDVVKYCQNGTQYDVSLKDSTGAPVANKTITITLSSSSWKNPAQYNKITNADGIATLVIGLNPGDYTVKSTFEDFNVTNTIKVLPVEVSANDVTITYKDGSFKATVTGGGKPVAGATVKFTVKVGTNPVYNIVTNADGVASLPINLAVGTYSITSSVGNSKVITNKITVVSKGKDVITASNLNMHYKDGSAFTAKVTNNGNPVKGATVKFTIYLKGKLVNSYNKVTNADGIASLPINLAVGTYSIASSIPDGTVYNTLVVGNELPKPKDVITASDLTLEYKNGSAFTAKVTNATGAPLKGVTVKFTVKTGTNPVYERVTNADGVASLPIGLNVGTYTVTAAIDDAQVSKKVTVLQTSSVIKGNDISSIKDVTVSYNVTLTSKSGQPIDKAVINFNVNGKKISATTDAKGVAKVDLTGLPVGENTINYEYAGDKNYKSSKDSSKITIINSTTAISGSDISVPYGDSAEFEITLKNISGEPLADKTINVNFNGESKEVVTNDQGIAKLDIPNDLAPGKYEVNYSYSKLGEKDYSYGSNYVTVNKAVLNVEANDMVKEPGDVKYFEVLVTNKNTIPVSNVNVNITVAGKSYIATTNDQGIASLKIELKVVGVYDITYRVCDNDKYSSDLGSNKIIVNGTIIKGNNIDVEYGSDASYEASLTDAYGKPIAGKEIIFTIENDEISAVTDDNGIARIALPKLEPGSYNITYAYTPEGKAPVSGKSTVTVKGGVPLKSVLTAATTLKKYIESNNVLPSTVTVDGETYTTPQFLYMLAQATVMLNEGKTGNIYVSSVQNPANPVKTTVSGNLMLSGYIETAYNIISYIDEKGIAPDSMNTALGKSGYDPLVYAFARVVAYYENNGMMPNYVTLKAFSAPIPSSPLDNVNDIENLTPYLQPTKNCQVDNAEIQALAAKLTAGLESDVAKATAIFNYVRDTVSYSFYYNTRYGAYNTLFKYKTGNCCDKASAVIALFRAAGLPARYVHGTCKFSSGTYGHVWAQVLIGDTWVVADTTSARNSFGVVNNWNNYNYQFKARYIELPF
ncbi:MAG: Ig-like domain-containing protein [Methanobrevibacter sp.]|uniref:Ig-like domain repeat protein n=1 Tax=Methanobrevibacter sp. TaxID=66852 RepID=UPI0026E0D839|nr:Ig-like domain-containing protein [Methanobrevibacter sp.]MDO5848815.1 Ig-like domain-containing protein [Methanobrevibacter sp.]